MCLDIATLKKSRMIVFIVGAFFVLAFYIRDVQNDAENGKILSIENGKQITTIKLKFTELKTNQNNIMIQQTETNEGVKRIEDILLKRR